MKLFVVLLALACSAARADIEPFVERCAKLAAAAKIQVVFEDRPVSRDDARSVAELRLFSQMGANPYHSVLGITHAEPVSHLVASIQTLADSDGRVCAVPLLTLTLGFSVLQVQVARDLQNACRRAIVEAHEQEHVAIWRNHLRAGARLLTTLLQNELGQVVYFADGAAAQASLQQRVDQRIASQLTALKSGIHAAHAQLDSPGSYRYEEGRMRACP